MDINLHKNELIKFTKEVCKKRMLFFTIIDICIHGKSRKDLELIRIGLNNRLNKKLEKQYTPYLNEMREEKNNNKNKIIENPVWIAWFQGIENAPDIVRKCYNSLHSYLPDKKIILITESNYNDFVKLPITIEKKRKSGIISDAHFSDILRIELLYTYGGTWIDSTVLLTDSNFPKAFFNADFFIFQKLKPGSNGDKIGLSSWFIHSIPNHEIIRNTRAMLFNYWENKNHLVDYFLLHHFLAISKKRFEMKNKPIPKFSNDVPHMLLLEMNERFDDDRLKDILKATPVHKLSYKKVPKKAEGTIYEHIINKLI
ncbi:capsular polysaccharide synthesis protein [Enterococcus casseliflavus]|uniref:capsular polysaccharide synthesis protein n=1 Tax=Enterococcus casseliflavus TaxID=37734 RepID=UPI0023D7F42D|nr:capsular polysaccharide synthesis protein [Enterococcus casseliflavus]WEI93502.1 capsular polysaccharide synthesis protein [Enterococcus casseliflavus]